MGIKVRKKHGSWYVLIDYHGQRKARKVGSREAAEQVRRELEARLALGDLGFLKEDDRKSPLFAEYAENWLEHHADRHLKPSTADFYREFLALYVLPSFGTSRINEIRREVVKRWIAELASRGLARNTLRLAVSTLRVVLNAAIEDGLLEANPAQKLGRLVKAEKLQQEATALTAEEVDRFLATAFQHSPQHYPFF